MSLTLNRLPLFDTNGDGSHRFSTALAPVIETKHFAIATSSSTCARTGQVLYLPIFFSNELTWDARVRLQMNENSAWIAEGL